MNTRQVLSSHPCLADLSESLIDALAFSFTEEALYDGRALGASRGEPCCFIVLDGTVASSTGRRVRVGELVCKRPGQTGETYFAEGRAQVALMHPSAYFMLMHSRSPISQAFRSMVTARSTSEYLWSERRPPARTARRISARRSAPVVAGLSQG
jgi:hypothetical protein